MALLDTTSERVILASASPRRKALFKLILDTFEVIESHVDEGSNSSQAPVELVIELARRKGEQVARTIDRGIVISADSVVVLNDEILGKPRDEPDAVRMLSRLSDQYHKVFTGFSIFKRPEEKYVSEVEETLVKFRRLADWEIRRYIQVGHPFDKAGAYGIQNEAALFVERIEGCYYNVMGLPVARVFNALCPFLNNLYGDKR